MFFQIPRCLRRSCLRQCFWSTHVLNTVLQQYECVMSNRYRRPEQIEKLMFCSTRRIASQIQQSSNTITTTIFHTHWSTIPHSILNITTSISSVLFEHLSTLKTTTSTSYTPQSITHELPLYDFVGGEYVLGARSNQKLVKVARTSQVGSKTHDEPEVFAEDFDLSD